MKDLLANIIIIAFVVLLAIVISIGFIMLGWYLFVVPVFGLPPLTILQALGLCLLINASKTKVDLKRN